MKSEIIPLLLFTTWIYCVHTAQYNNEGNGWKKYLFQLNNTWNDCTGTKWIYHITEGENSGLIVGVIQCTETGRIGIFLTNFLTDTFLKVRDTWGEGQDHCELVGLLGVTNYNDTRITLGEVLQSTNLDPADPTKIRVFPGYFRREPGDKFEYKADLAVDTHSAWTPKWYECGDVQFVPQDDVCSKITCEHLCVPENGQPVCKCSAGYKLSDSGDMCVDINECSTSNGNCEDMCTNTGGSYFCRCEAKYSNMVSVLNADGRRCDISCYAGYSLSVTETSCIDINECATNDGECASACVNKAGSFYCTCTNGGILGNDGRSCSNAVSGGEGGSDTTANLDAGGLLGAVIALAVLSALLSIGLLIACIYLCTRRRRDDDDDDEDEYSRRRSMRSHSPVSYSRSTPTNSARFGMFGMAGRGRYY